MATIQRGAALTCAFLCGAAAGAAVAIAFAPVSGRELRRQLADKARENRDLATEAVERGRVVFEAARGRVQQQAEHVSRAVAESRKAWHDVRDRGEEALGRIRAEAVDALADAREAGRDLKAGIARTHE